ncbi:DUF1015 domain-containing protein [Kamptonema cortianum]|nr:DUF1015 domain-containing protein [Geitlerinema splendidum]MDK3157001.1 DUF1015 domain-containing protein [Kamptonema cortianum]
MATIRPFKGLRFKADGSELSQIVAPPYDVISPDQREHLAAKNEHNVVRLTLPEQMPDDRSKYIKYARSASRLEEWRRDGVVDVEDQPAYYRYTQSFTVPGSGEVFTRTKLIATIKVEPYANKVVLPHEQTFPKHKEDRLRILEATRSHLECIFGLYEDDTQQLHNLVVNSPAEIVADFITEDDGIRHIFEMISDSSSCQAITEGMAEKSVWIADGHHRYETALAFREALGEKDGPVAEDYMMMALCSISDPGLVLLPTHRILKNMPVDANGLKERLAEHFDLSSESHENLMATIEKMNASGDRAFGIALPNGEGVVARVKNLDAIVSQMSVAGSDELKRLDVSVLHGFIFEKLLGLTGHDFFSYTRIEEEALDAVEQGAPAAFLMNPPTVDDMRVIALGGDFMPQKSTYYYPKLLSGLVMWSLKDFSL